MDIKQSLEQIGLKQKQIEIYLLLLQMGEAMVQDLSTKTKIKRTTVYSTLDSLVSLGLVIFVDKSFHRYYYAENPKKIAIYFKDKKQDIENQEKRFSEVLPELSGLYNLKATKPKIRYYEGSEGIKQIYKETLLLKPGSELLGYTTADILHDFLGDDFVKFYLDGRVKAKISAKVIAPKTEMAQIHVQNDRAEMRETILIDAEKFPFTNEINIFGSKVSIISFKDLMGVVIESADVASTQKAIFELAWLGAKTMEEGKNREDWIACPELDEGWIMKEIHFKIQKNSGIMAIPELWLEAKG